MFLTCAVILAACILSEDRSGRAISPSRRSCYCSKRHIMIRVRMRRNTCAKMPDINDVQMSQTTDGSCFSMNQRYSIQFW